MFIHSALIEKFKNIMHVEFKADGNHIIISGMNGAGKTAVLEAILTAIFGKKVLPDDPILHGQESALIDCGLCGDRGGKILYKLKAKITDKAFGLTVSTFGPGGEELTVRKPVEFLSSLVTRDFIDPDEFCKKDGKDRISMLYRLLPGLQESIDKLQKEYEEEQSKRSAVNIEKTRLEGELLNTPFTEGLPEEVVDPAELMQQIQDAETHNLQKVGLENSLKSLEHDIAIHDELTDNIKKSIEHFKREIAAAEERLNQVISQRQSSEEALSATKKKIEKFIPKDVVSLRLQIATLNQTNDAIGKNQRIKELEKQIADKSAKYSAGLKAMRDIEEKKIAVYRDAHMPVDGLAVGNGDITFPDPVSGEIVLFSSLSTGQKAMVSVGILSAFLPPPEKGLRCMVINDVNALDENNYNAMLHAADKNNVQLVMHKTVFKSETNKLEIVIEEN